MEKDWFQVNFGNWVIMILIGFRVIMVILVINTIVERSDEKLLLKKVTVKV